MKEIEKERVTPENRQTLHDFIDTAIDKMNSPKNINKTHWHCMENAELVELLIIEAFELRHAVLYPHQRNIVNECKDVSNFACMIADNAMRGGK